MRVDCRAVRKDVEELNAGDRRRRFADIARERVQAVENDIRRQRDGPLVSRAEVDGVATAGAGDLHRLSVDAEDGEL